MKNHVGLEDGNGPVLRFPFQCIGRGAQKVLSTETAPSHDLKSILINITISMIYSFFKSILHLRRVTMFILRALQRCSKINITQYRGIEWMEHELGIEIPPLLT